MFAILLLIFGSGRSSVAQVTERMSVNSIGRQGVSGGERLPGRSISSSGRWVAFLSSSWNLAPGDTNWNWDVFVRDRIQGSTVRVSVSSLGAEGNGPSGVFGICISSDGRYVAFDSRASTLVDDDTNGAIDVFVHDLLTGTTERVSVDSNGVGGNRDSIYPALSSDGRFVAFTSLASNLVPNDTNGVSDTFVHDRQTGQTERVSVATDGSQGNFDSYRPGISADGRFVVFESDASNLIAGGTNGRWQIFLHDRQAGSTELVSQSSAGEQANFDCQESTIYGDGRFVLFTSSATNLLAGDNNGEVDVFLRDRLTGTTECESLAFDGAQANRGAATGTLSDDFRYVSFSSPSTNLTPGGSPISCQVYLRDRWSGAVELLSAGVNGSVPNGLSAASSMSPDARFVTFESEATNLVLGDTNGWPDFFVRDRLANGTEIVCEPGVSGVIDCPCGNPASGAQRGCDNSSSTGGATLSASGAAYLSIDSLALATSGEPPTALSTLFEGTTIDTLGAIYGQGVRCVGGLLVRLYSKSAVAGVLTFPDASAGDPTISARSRAKGLSISPGRPSYFFVAYRDATVLGGCPQSSTFNATASARTIWWP